MRSDLQTENFETKLLRNVVKLVLVRTISEEIRVKIRFGKMRFHEI